MAHDSHVCVVSRASADLLACRDSPRGLRQHGAQPTSAKLGTSGLRHIPYGSLQAVGPRPARPAGQERGSHAQLLSKLSGSFSAITMADGLGLTPAQVFKMAGYAPVVPRLGTTCFCECCFSPSQTSTHGPRRPRSQRGPCLPCLSLHGSRCGLLISVFLRSGFKCVGCFHKCWAAVRKLRSPSLCVFEAPLRRLE